MATWLQQKKTILNQALALVVLSSLASCVQVDSPSYGGTPSYDKVYLEENRQRPGGDYTNFRTRDADSCAEACTNDSRCRALDFNKRDRTCWLKDTVQPARENWDVISGVKEGNNNSGGYYPPNYPSYPEPPSQAHGIQLYNNVKRNGGDYTHFTVDNVEECARACSRDNRCHSINYGKERRDCWLKNNVPGGVPNNTVISGVKRGGNSGGHYPSNLPSYPEPPSQAYGIQLYDNVKRNGGDYTNFTVDNVEECARECSRDYKCQSFNYGKQRRDCWLKNNVPAGVPNNTVISGVKRR